MDWVASPKLFFGIRGGYYMSDCQRLERDRGAALHLRTTTAVQDVGYRRAVPESEPAAVDRLHGVPVELQRDDQRPADPRVLPGRRHGLREHGRRAPDQVRRAGRPRRQQRAQRRSRATASSLRWNTPLPGGCPSARHLRLLLGAQQRVDPQQGFITEGNIHTNNIGLFIQDAWTINNRLTINAGVRTERERVPTYTDAARTFPSSASSSASRTSWRRASASPTTSRATAARRCSAPGACSTTSSSSSCRAARSAATSGSSTYYTLDTFDWTTLVAGAELPAGLPGNR